MNDRNLANYLNNHLAGSVAGMELVKRALSENRGTDLARFFERLLHELEEDQEAVRKVVKGLGRSESLSKEVGAWALEKLALIPLTVSDRELRRVLQIEAILVGTVGRLGMWRLLERLGPLDPRLAIADFTFFRQRTEAHAQALENYREEAAAPAFAE